MVRTYYTNHNTSWLWILSFDLNDVILTVAAVRGFWPVQFIKCDCSNWKDSITLPADIATFSIHQGHTVLNFRILWIMGSSALLHVKLSGWTVEEVSCLCRAGSIVDGSIMYHSFVGLQTCCDRRQRETLQVLISVVPQSYRRPRSCTVYRSLWAPQQWLLFQWPKHSHSQSVFI